MKRALILIALLFLIQGCAKVDFTKAKTGMDLNKVKQEVGAPKKIKQINILGQKVTHYWYSDKDLLIFINNKLDSVNLNMTKEEVQEIKFIYNAFE